MNSLKHVFIFLFCVSTFLTETFAQGGDVVKLSEQVWVDYDASYHFKDRWAWVYDIGYRRETQQQWNQLVIRPGFQYTIANNFNATAGLGYFGTFNEQAFNTHEFRLYQGFATKWPNRQRVEFRHYVRLEERFYPFSDTPAKVRGRYQLRFLYHFLKNEEHRIDGVACAEPFFDFSSNSEGFFNQERVRFFVGASYQHARNWRIRVTVNIQGNRPSSDAAFNRTDGFIRLSFTQFLKNSIFYENFAE